LTTGISVFNEGGERIVVVKGEGGLVVEKVNHRCTTGETTRIYYQTKPIPKMGQITHCDTRSYENSRERKLGYILGYKNAWQKGGENGAQIEQRTDELHNVCRFPHKTAHEKAWIVATQTESITYPTEHHPSHSR
jgi:hypothetical protein